MGFLQTSNKQLTSLFDLANSSSARNVSSWAFAAVAWVLKEKDYLSKKKNEFHTCLVRIWFLIVQVLVLIDSLGIDIDSK